MTKAELISELASRTGSTTAAANEAVNTIIEIVKDALKDGEDVSLKGFGVFETVERAARVGRNPQTGETLQIPSCRYPKFSPSKVLKESLN